MSAFFSNLKFIPFFPPSPGLTPLLSTRAFLTVLGGTSQLQLCTVWHCIPSLIRLVICITSRDTAGAQLTSIHIFLLLLLFVLRRREAQVEAGRRGLAAARGPPAAAALAGPPGVHAQPHGGRPDLGADRPRATPLGAPALPGARRHPSQHEATGEWRCSA